MNQFEVSKEIELDYGHVLPNNKSFCNQLHGHRAKVIATISGTMNNIEDDSSQGMILDFKMLKLGMMENIHDKLDHGFAVWKKDVDLDFIIRRNKKYLITEDPPTAEYLAKWAFEQLSDLDLPEGAFLEKVEWYETPTSVATYRG